VLVFPLLIIKRISIIMGVQKKLGIAVESDSLRRVLDRWCLLAEEETTGENLSRFLIALDELRARLAPAKYPNIEVSDEGHLYFTVEASVGTIEVIAFPFGFGKVEWPSFLVSFPGKAEEVSLDFLNRIYKISETNEDFELFAGFSTDGEILDAYRRDRHPPLVCTKNLEEILEMKKEGVFFSYLGICFPMRGKTVSEAEETIRIILSGLEKLDRAKRKNSNV